nr:hypothetical protein [Tanacetum cinerariifolium]
MSTSATHNAIIEASDKDHAPMLVAGPYEYQLVTYPEEMWIAIEPLMQGENINKPDVETNLLWAIEWQRFMKIIKQGQDLKTNSYHKLFDILKQHHNEVNEIQAKSLARNANPLALVAATQQQPSYYPQPKPTYNPPTSSTRSHATTLCKGKEIAKAHSLPLDSKHKVVSDEEETLRDTEIAKLMALISTSFNKINKLINNHLRSSSNTRYQNFDNSLRVERRTRDNRHTGQNDI